MTTIVPNPWPATAVPELAPGEVHVWSAALDAPDGPPLLTPDEHERAGRLVTEDLRRRWSRARSTLRELLAAYALADPLELRIEPAPCVHCGELHGKPFLAAPEGTELRFNLSHSDALALVAIARGREVGVDVEATRAGRRMQGIADSSFTAHEAAELRALSDADRTAAFYRLWARKEAYLKATAAGLGGSLDSFDALRLEPVTGPAAGWEFADLEVGSAYAGALAVAPPGYSPGG